jgi:hypothetical protein
MSKNHPMSGCGAGLTCAPRSVAMSFDRPSLPLSPLTGRLHNLRKYNGLSSFFQERGDLR